MELFILVIGASYPPLRAAMFPPPPAKRARIRTGRTLRSSKPTLGPDIYAGVATFVDLGQTLLNVCVAAGPSVAKNIRTLYLLDNNTYLERTLAAYIDDSQKPNKYGQNIRTWMEVNTSWRDRCTEEKMEQCKDLWFVEQNENGEDIRTAIVRADAIFNNPAVAAQLGLVDVLKCLVEVKRIDVNALSWDGYQMNRISAPKHLIFAHAISAADTLQRATDQDSLTAVRYLLSLEGLDLAAAEINGTPLLIIAVYNDTLDAQHFEAIVRHPSCNVNPNTNMSPLYFLVHLLELKSNRDGADAPTSRLLVSKARSLLESGAQPDRETGNLAAPILVARGFLNRAQDNSAMREIVELFEHYSSNNM